MYAWGVTTGPAEEHCPALCLRSQFDVARVADRCDSEPIFVFPAAERLHTYFRAKDADKKSKRMPFAGTQRMLKTTDLNGD